MNVSEIKEKYGHIQNDAVVSLYEVPVSYSASGNDKVTVKANNSNDAVNAAKAQVERRLAKASLKLDSFKSGKVKMSIVAR